ncbi:DUF2085 domain-containing protein [Methanothermobacter wolfeii]|uniref:DUF2085 domain-containing protein n=1 Tax=Methanothermobacter wolfeii TaxID=145261 RepID=A0ABU8TTX4_METWO
MKLKYLCHRKPERTFSVRGHYFPVCSRCTGIYTGAFAYFIYAYFTVIEYNITLIIIAFLMIVPTFLDGFTQLLGYRESNNVLRFSTGVPAGVGLGIITKAIKYFIWTLL